MSGDADQLVQKAIEAFKARQKSQARDLLMQAVDLDEKNEQAWLWLSAVVDSKEDQQVCLENVLTINPTNERARKGLEVLYQQQGKPLPSQFAAPAPTTSTPGPSSTPAFVSNPFAGTGFDANPWGVDSGDPATGWSQDVIATSVDWGKDGAKAAHGSGRQVAQPSSDEYDQWLSSLNIGQDPSGAFTTSPGKAEPVGSSPWESAPSASGAKSPSGDSGWEGLTGAPATEKPFKSSTAGPWDNLASGPFGEARTDALFTGEPSPPDAGFPAQREPFQVTRLVDDQEKEASSIFNEEPLFGDEQEPRFAFEDQGDAALPPALAKQQSKDKKARKKARGKTTPTKQSVVTVINARYFAAIPGEITAPAKGGVMVGGPDRLLLLSTVGLAALNLLALVGLIVNLL
jgi:hypothetical protein